MASGPSAALLLLVLSGLSPLVCLGSGNIVIQTAVNITWSSINFKTILHWEPKPINYVYTVEIDGDRMNRRKICIHTTETECDVTSLLQDKTDTYIARIYSEPLQKDEDDIDTPPYEVSPEFRPYFETEIGVPKIKKFEQKDKTLTVEVEDQITPYKLKNGSFETLRDIFKDHLEYKLFYWKDQSTGKKWTNTKSNLFEVSIDRGNNYCFYVQASIPSRAKNQSSQKSIEKCTSAKRDQLDDLSLEAILIIIAVTVGILALIIIFAVVVYKCTRQKPASSKKESVPLNL